MNNYANRIRRCSYVALMQIHALSSTLQSSGYSPQPMLTIRNNRITLSATYKDN